RDANLVHEGIEIIHHGWIWLRLRDRERDESLFGMFCRPFVAVEAMRLHLGHRHLDARADGDVTQHFFAHEAHIVEQFHRTGWLSRLTARRHDEYPYQHRKPSHDRSSQHEADGLY